jgi:CheY-like chemotaxis protein
MVAVIGSLEKRVAFYVPDAGVIAEGKALEGVVPVWQGPAHLVAQVEERRIALLDADQIIEEYLDLTGELNTEGVSGGVVEDESELSNGQAPNDSVIKTPPDLSVPAEEADEREVEVLIVEQSESLRSVFNDILGSHRIPSAIVGGVDEAIELIHARAPRVIISEFRMPTMAAKVLVEILDREGQSIPVLVTTSQSGGSAGRKTGSRGLSEQTAGSARGRKPVKRIFDGASSDRLIPKFDKIPVFGVGMRSAVRVHCAA